MSETQNLNSCIYRGEVFHQRFSPRKHKFSYHIFLLAIDLDELPQLNKIGRYFKTDRFAPLRFFAPDYLTHKSSINKQDVWDKVAQLGGKSCAGRVMFIGQMRCFGLYFSPINNYYCYNENNQLRYMLAEVSNTPWNERHYYLIDLQGSNSCEKSFHVSPFMDLDMQYRWRITPPSQDLKLTIENIVQDTSKEKLFTASINMKQQAFTNKNLLKNLLAIPVMTVKTVFGIYWQALKLYIKGVPYIAHSKKEKANVS